MKKNVKLLLFAMFLAFSVISYSGTAEAWWGPGDGYGGYPGYGYGGYPGYGYPGGWGGGPGYWGGPGWGGPDYWGGPGWGGPGYWDDDYYDTWPGGDWNPMNWFFD